MSAFGAKRTCPGHRWALDRSRMTQSGHERLRGSRVAGCGARE